MRYALNIGPGYQINMAIQNLAKLARARDSSEYEGHGLDATRTMAAMKAGIAILPSLYALQKESRDQDLCVRKIQDVRTSRAISLVWRDTSLLADDFEALAVVVYLLLLLVCKQFFQKTKNPVSWQIIYPEVPM